MSLAEWKVENGSQIQEAAVSRRFLTDTSSFYSYETESLGRAWD